MNGFRLPKHSPDLASPPFPKRLWCLLTSSSHRSSPPPRFLFVLLLSAQILFLALIRLGPASFWPTSPPASPSSPLFVGSAGARLPLNLENTEAPSLPAGETRPSEPQGSDQSSRLTSESSFSPASLSETGSTSANGDASTGMEENSLSEMSSSGNGNGNGNADSDGSLTSEGKSRYETPILITGDDDAPQTTKEKSLSESSPASTTSDYVLLPSIEDKFLATSGSAGSAPLEDRAVTTKGNGDTEEKSLSETPTFTASDEAAPAIDEKSPLSETPVAKDNDELLLPSVEDNKPLPKSKVSTFPPEETKSTVEQDSTNPDSSATQSTEDYSSTMSIPARDQVPEVQSEAILPDNGKEVQPSIAEEVFSGSSQCQFGYIYVYDLPPVFNSDIVANCSALNPWMDVCPTLANGGLGESLGDASPLGQTGSWYISDQFTAEIVFHNRILQHPCLTDKPELASGFYVPFYAGMDVGRFLWEGSPAERRDRVSKQLLEWLDGQHYWKRNGGWDHFLMIGRITWDFRRSRDDDWGSGFFYNPPMLNTTRLLIERNPWDNQEMAVPYPTNFHPQSDADLRAWQKHLRGLRRSTMFSFAGAPRKRFPNDFRGILLEQCQRAGQKCQALDCSGAACDNNQKTLDLFVNSTFCLQPRGDSFTRRSTFDCLLAGAIPVFFWHRSAYLQYKWHLPSDEGSYSVFIPKEDMRNGVQIEQVLGAIEPEKVRQMQEAVIELIPRIVYAVSGFSLKEDKDAFDVAIEGVMRRFRELGLSSAAAAAA